MNYSILLKEENEAIKERYQLAIERIQMIREEQSVEAPYYDYFTRTADFIKQIHELVIAVEENSFLEMSQEDLKRLNDTLYEDIIGENYQTSYANPAYATTMLGGKYGRLLAVLYTELRGGIIYAYEYRLFELTIYLELFIEIYNYFEEQDEFTYKDVKRSIYDFMSDYSEDIVAYRTRELLDVKLSFARDIIMESEFSDPRYLYQYGDYITDNELRTAAYLNTFAEDQIQDMADTFTEGFRMGFITNRLDLSKKSIVNIRYQIGFERIVRYAVKNFEKLGLKVTIYRAAINAINKKQHIKIGYHATSPNKQYDYDHRFDIALCMDKAFKERKLMNLKLSLEEYKEEASHYAGPAVMEVFGEELFAPEDKKEAIKLDKRQQKLYVDYNNEANLINHVYLKTGETSYTIIAYPIPEIGQDFEAIFSETVKVNTLDSNLYKNIQQTIIDSLDQGEYVRILGQGINQTDMKVMLYRLKDKDKESIFENCIADVNIPVGEVFTSPVLKGTQGVLHVPRIYLNEIEFKDLKLTFEEGRITEFSCKNFSNEENNRSFIKENLLFNHDTLPLGEFAIGTNTTAYRMGKKFGIAEKLPILIAEKTGPHFAIGDTCYRMSEEVKIYNPDGKEIVARENEISALRKTEPEKAYFNCHTDITLPYDEIKEIAVYTEKGTAIPIIQNGRFVLEGTQVLNDALDER